MTSTSVVDLTYHEESYCYFQCVKRAQIPTSMKEAMWNIEEENNEEEKRSRDGGWA